jgi:hypothetical protein
MCFVKIKKKGKMTDKMVADKNQVITRRFTWQNGSSKNVPVYRGRHFSDVQLRNNRILTGTANSYNPSQMHKLE